MGASGVWRVREGKRARAEEEEEEEGWWPVITGNSGDLMMFWSADQISHFRTIILGTCAETQSLGGTGGPRECVCVCVVFIVLIIHAHAKFVFQFSLNFVDTRAPHEAHRWRFVALYWTLSVTTRSCVQVLLVTFASLSHKEKNRPINCPWEGWFDFRPPAWSGRMVDRRHVKHEADLKNEHVKLIRISGYMF